MAKQQKRWMYNPPRSTPPKIPESIKADVTAKANELIETSLKAAYIKPHTENEQFNYIIDIYGKWYRSSFYFCATYRVAGPHPTVPTFEAKFARMTYAGNNHFHLSFMRYTGQWIQLYSDLPVDECLATIRDDAYFQL